MPASESSIAVFVNSSPSVNYSTAILNFDSIYANTRFTFQPDTIRPANLASLSFSNVLPGCLSVDISEASSNESLVTLERADSGTNYLTEKLNYNFKIGDPNLIS